MNITLPNSKREIDKQLVEGLESGDAIKVNDEFWTERRRVLEQRTDKHLAPEARQPIGRGVSPWGQPAAGQAPEGRK
jgi:hypothetical protein